MSSHPLPGKCSPGARRVHARFKNANLRFALRVNEVSFVSVIGDLVVIEKIKRETASQ